VGLLVILIAAIITYLVGTFIPPTSEKISKGVIGYKGKSFYIGRKYLKDSYVIKVSNFILEEKNLKES
jgi:hypothetical protein